MSTPINKAYISPIDKFLQLFNKEHRLSASQRKEMEKHRRIAELRDHAVSDHPKEPLI